MNPVLTNVGLWFSADGRAEAMFDGQFVRCGTDARQFVTFEHGVSKRLRGENGCGEPEGRDVPLAMTQRWPGAADARRSRPPQSSIRTALTRQMSSQYSRMERSEEK